MDSGTVIRAKRNFVELIGAHDGARICVMGGAPGLAEQLARVEADVYISTNAHGVDLVRPDYLLAMDEENSRETRPMGKFLRERAPGVPIISPHGYGDWRLGWWPQNPRFVLSGMIGAWAAFAMGAKVVILAGCDGYGGDSGYVDEARKIARDIHCPVRVAGGGPLSRVWPAYDSKEISTMEHKTSTALEGLKGNDGLICVEALKPCTAGSGRNVPQQLEKGDQVVGMRHEFARLLKHRMVKEVPMPDEKPVEKPKGKPGRPKKNGDAPTVGEPQPQANDGTLPPQTEDDQG